MAEKTMAEKRCLLSWFVSDRLRPVVTRLMLGLILSLVGAQTLSHAAGTAKKIPTSQAFYEKAIADSQGLEWQPLFNGTSLDGWKVVLANQKPGEDPEKIFQVVDGEVHVYRDTPAGKNMPFGVILTDKSFSEYRFRFEYRWGEKKFAPRQNAIRDAGLLFHVVGPEKIWPMSVECQVQEGDTGDNFLVYTSGDSPVDSTKKKFLDEANGGVFSTFYKKGGVTRVIKSETLEKDGWNTVEVIVRGDAAIYLVNGKINNYVVNMKAPIGPNQSEVPLTAGRLALQCEGAELFYRKMEILPLTKTQDSSIQVADESIAPIPPRSPEESLAAWQVRKGMRVELVAAEPHVIDPVAIDWGLDGKIWIAEMADYPLGLDGKGKSGGRIRILERSKETGKYDRSTVFLEGLNFPTGVAAWGKGVIVTAAPEIIYAEDSNGDGICDVKKVLFSGFHEGNHQLRLNGLRWGLDGWLHCASGSHHAGYGTKSKIRSHITGKEVPVGSRDFRFDPSTGELEPLSGPSQFGRNRDDWGNWFGVQNSYPLWHYIYEERYFRRNPDFVSPDMRVLLSEGSPRVFPVAQIEAQPNPHTRVGRFTSACSGMIYRDSLLPLDQEFSHGFTCEPVHNLIQHHHLKRSGASFMMTRDVEGELPDFLASTDRWCRPVMARTGPDGALWVVDMYRYIIEHPEWVPKAAQIELEPYLRLGDGRGRLYRVVPENGQHREVPDVLGASPAQLVELLNHPNGWVRDAAQRRLVEAKNPAANALLKVQLQKSPSALTRLHSLYALHNQGMCEPEVLMGCFSDPSEDIRRHALKLAEGIKTPSDEFVNQLVKLVNDPSDAVRLQLAFSLGEWEHPKVFEAFGAMWEKSGNSGQITDALNSSLTSKNLSHAVIAVSKEPVKDTQSAARLRSLLQQSIAKYEPAFVVGYVRGWNGGRENVAQAMIALDLINLYPHNGKMFASIPENKVKELNNEARRIVEDGKSPDWLRLLGVQFLGSLSPSNADDLALVKQLLSVNSSAELQAGVVQKLGRLRSPDSGRVLVSGWSSYRPTIRSSILDVLASRVDWLTVLVEAIDQKIINPNEINLTLQQRFLSQKSSPELDKLKAQFKAHGSSSAAVMVKLDDVLKLETDLNRGRIAFQKHCIDCHQFRGEGVLVGPNLSSVTGRTRASMFEAILDPNKAVEPKYLNYVLELVDGRVLSGIIDNDTENSLTLLKAKAEKTSVLRSEIEALQSSGKSLMPEGFDRTITPQELADLLFYLEQSGDVASTN